MHFERYVRLYKETGISIWNGTDIWNIRKLKHIIESAPNPNCGLINRNLGDKTTFHKYPVRENDKCLTWLVNCGLDD